MHLICNHPNKIGQTNIKLDCFSNHYFLNISPSIGPAWPPHLTHLSPLTCPPFLAMHMLYLSLPLFKLQASSKLKALRYSGQIEQSFNAEFKQKTNHQKLRHLYACARSAASKQAKRLDRTILKLREYIGCFNTITLAS